jgi:basic amino acid/polyamine antiporter, APA family
MTIRPPRTAAPPASPVAAVAPASSVATTRDGDRLPRRLGFWATAAVVVGTIIGSGIFRVPAEVATQVGSVAGIATVWVLGGVIALCGVLAIAELAAAFPESGGVFVYLREAYGPGVAFVYGWTMLFLAPTGTAAIALVFAEYLGAWVPLGPAGVRLVAAGVIVLVAVAGYRSVRGAGAIQGAATLGKLAALVALVLAAFLLGDRGAGAFGRGVPPADEAHWGGVGLALVAALWAYNGFQDMVCIAGEVRDPGRVLPRALLAGNVAVIAVYLAANAAYLYVLPYGALRASPLVASDAMVRVLGGTGAAAVAAMVMISTFGALNGLVLTQPRVFYAMAKEGLLFAPLARVHPRFATPHVAVASFAAVAVAGVWSRTFEQLAEAFVLGVFPFLALAAAGVLALRRRRPDLARPYRTPGYPVVPLVFVAGTLWVVVSALIARPATTLGGIGLTLIGVPVYLLWRRAGRRRGVPAVRAAGPVGGA